MILKEIITKVSEDINLPRDTVEEVYKLYWKYIKDTMASLDLDNMSKEELTKCKHSFNIPSLGKFYTSNEYIEKIKVIKEKQKNNDKT